MIHTAAARGCQKADPLLRLAGVRSKSKYETKREKTSGNAWMVIVALTFASGFAGLVYQVLWMKQLGLLFGNTSHAAAATLAAFFAGLGTGGWWWGRRVSTVERPLRLYAWLEFGIAMAALAYFVVLKAFDAVYPALHEMVYGTSWVFVLKFVFALLLVFPPAFFMGGTVPAIGQVMIRQPDALGRTGAMLYGVNTLGAAIGVAIAAFVLVPSMGFSTTYLLAVLLSGLVGIVAWKMPEMEATQPASENPDKRSVAKQGATPQDPVPAREKFSMWALCFVSGFVILALEVVWTRIFAQYHENSVYSYAIILIVVLVGLAAGSGISSIVSRFVNRPWAALGVMTLVGGGLLVLGPSILMRVTDGLSTVHTLEPWGDYVRGLFDTGIRGLGFVVVAMGTVFPFLMKLAEREGAASGGTLGRLLAINTAGAIAGALLCGFVLLPAWGMWGTLQALTAMYLVVALLLPLGWGPGGIICRVAGLAFLFLNFTALDPQEMPVTGSGRGTEGDKVLQVWEGSDCTVTVIGMDSGHRAIKINGGYGLGSTEAYLEQAYQSRIPLYLHPETESIFFLGMGTGISAGASLDERFPKVRRVLTCELVPAVVEASQTWIPKEMTGGLFSDPRSTVRIEDGRHLLRVSKERFDMINADLFLPYERGAGSLYSLEHFRVAASRLNEGGVFVQWLPLYQLTEQEFGVIARTMLEAFPEVTMWRNNFQPGQEKVALIGRNVSSPAKIPASGKKEAMLAAVDGLGWRETHPDMFRVAEESMPFLYAGNLRAAADLFRDYPVNTDDRPVIEYQTPKTFRKVAARDKVIWCVGPHLTKWIDRLHAACPPEKDPVWSGHPEASHHFIRAGASFHRAMVGKVLGEEAELDKEWEIFLREWRLGAQ